MKKILVLLFLSVFLIVKPHLVSAHLSGQPPFFLINGTYTGFYPVYVTSLKDFVLPQDTAPENYLLGQELGFEIDSAMLPFPQDIINKITFTWDFGDGTKNKGLKIKHSYKKIGSFLLKISADYAGYNDPNTKSLLQAILINIVPDKDYKLPKAIIKINNREVKDPNQPVQVSNKSITLDGSSSKNGSAKIISYFWDKGDGESTPEQKFKDTYSGINEVYVFPMLRVKDANGFINDTFVQIDMSSTNESSRPTLSPLVLVGLLNILAVGGIIFYIKRGR